MLRKIKSLMLVANMYPLDGRVRKEALALTAHGHDVSVIALRGEGELFREEVNGVHVYRVPNLNVFGKRAEVNSENCFYKFWIKLKSSLGFIIEHLYFSLMSFIYSLFILKQRGFDLVHAHNPPDLLVLIGCFYRIFGKKYVFDHHDLAPELYKVRCSGKADFIYRVLFLLEELSCRYANLVIATNESYKRLVATRHHISPEKIFVVRNDPIMKDFKSLYHTPGNGECRLIYLGCTNPQDGVEILLRATSILVHKIRLDNFICDILGDGDSLEELKSLASELKIEKHVRFHGYVKNRKEVYKYLSAAEIGLEPAPDNEFNRHSTFIKVLEYMAAGKAVVAFDLIESRYSLDSAGQLVPYGGPDEFAEGIKELLENRNLREQMGKAGQARVFDQLNWEKSSMSLIAAYSILAGDNV